MINRGNKERIHRLTVWLFSSNLSFVLSNLRFLFSLTKITSFYRQVFYLTVKPKLYILKRRQKYRKDKELKSTTYKYKCVVEDRPSAERRGVETSES